MSVFRSLIAFFALVAVPLCLAAAGPTAVPTFECLGLSWSPPAGSPGVECQAQYRKMGESVWKDAMDLWYDPADAEYRGSIVNLSPGTAYEVRLELDGLGVVETLAASTWNENPPIAQTIHVASSNQKLVIDQSGSASGWILYTSASGSTAVIDVANAQSSSIELAPGVHHVIIRDHGLLYNDCASRPHESHGVVIPGFPQYDPANGPMEFYLIPGSPGIDAGVPIPNFNDGYQGSAPDIGAFESGSPPLEFGVGAYLPIFADDFERGDTGAWSDSVN